MYTPVALSEQLRITHVVTAFDEVRPKGYFFSGEMHDFWEMAYVMEGAITVTADDRVYTLSRGQMIFHQPMEFHSLRCADGKPARVLVISFAAVGEGMNPFRRRVLELDFDEEAELLRLVEIFHDFLNNRQEMQGARGQALLEAFLWKLSDKPLHTVERHTAGDGKLYEQAMRVLNDHCREALGLSDIARLCNTSESSLKKAFAAYSHTGVMHCFNSIKIRLAARLLTQGYSAAQVSEQLSFSSPSYFHVVFRREMHCTPGQYVQKSRS